MMTVRTWKRFEVSGQMLLNEFYTISNTPVQGISEAMLLILFQNGSHFTALSLHSNMNFLSLN